MKPRPDMLDSKSPRSLEVFQLTTEAIPSSHVYMEGEIFTPDSKRFVVHRSAHPHGSDRHDPEHRYLLCDAATGAMSPLTDELGPTGPSISPDGKWFYYFVDKTDINTGSLTLKRVKLDGTGRETIVTIDKPLHGTTRKISKIYPLSTISSDGKRISISGYLGDGKEANSPWGLIVVDIDKGQANLILQGQSWCNLHPQYSRSLDPERAHDILIQDNHGCDISATGEFNVLVSGAGCDIHVIRDDGNNLRNMPWGRNGKEQCQGHQCWRGRSDYALTTAGFIDDKFEVANAGGMVAHAERLIEGQAVPHSGHDGADSPAANKMRNELSRNFEKPRFFHFATDIAGKRFVTDSNPVSPDRCDLWAADFGAPLSDPLQNWTYLLNTRTDFFKKGAHPHPFLSPDGKLAFFNSNESGVLQAYMVRGL